MPVGFKIKKLREEKDISQSKLASQLNISQSELSKIENGKAKKIDFYLMIKVCSIFNKDFYFFQNENTLKIENLTVDQYIAIILIELNKIADENKKKDKIIKSLKK